MFLYELNNWEECIFSPWLEEKFWIQNTTEGNDDPLLSFLR